MPKSKLKARLPLTSKWVSFRVAKDYLYSQSALSAWAQTDLCLFSFCNGQSALETSTPVNLCLSSFLTAKVLLKKYVLQSNCAENRYFNRSAVVSLSED